MPPRFRLYSETGPLMANVVAVETVRPDGSRQLFNLINQGEFWQSVAEIPEPHAFTALVRLDGDEHSVVFEEHEHAHSDAHRDNNMRAAIIHVIADAAVSVLVIAGLLLASLFGWLWMGPFAEIGRAHV